MKKIAFAMVAVAFSLSGCGKDPVATSSTNNPNVSVSLMFEHDGCKVYRFVDDGRYVYYSNCRGTTQSFKEETCGKGCIAHIPVTVQTVRD